MFKTTILKGLVLILLLATSATSALASTSYSPSNDREYLAYLQGVLDALRSQLAANVSGSGKVENDTPELQAEVALSATYEIGSQSYVYAWFEYGVGSLTKKTSRTKIERDRGEREVTHRRVLSNLEANSLYSYRAVFETRSGDRTYGAVGTFNTNGSVSTSGGFSSGSTVSNSRGSISLDKTTFEANDSIEVDWTVPRSKEASSNWIALYKTSASNQNYLSWSYLDDDDKGTVTLTAPAEDGSYELRLFYNNSYDDEVTSRRITVND